MIFQDRLTLFLLIRQLQIVQFRPHCFLW